MFNMKDFIINMRNNNTYIVDGESIYYFEDLRTRLIEEIKRDTIECREDKDIVENNLKLLEKVYNNNYGYDERFVINELKQYGYDIMKLKDIKDNLLTLKVYFNHNSSKDMNNELVQDINKVLEDINNYFKD